MKLRIKLHIGLAFTYTVSTLLLIGGVVGYLFFSTSQLIVETASKSMDAAAADVERSVNALFQPVGRSVLNAAYLLENADIDFHGTEGQRFFFRLIESMPEVASFYVAFDADGAFRQIVRDIADGTGTIGSTNGFTLRNLYKAPGPLQEQHFETWGQITKTNQGVADFDPRVRPWFLGAVETGQLTISDPYLFASSGRPGLTISKAASDSLGTVLAVIAADITLDGLSQYLGQKRVGENGRIFLIDQQGDLIVVSNEDTLDSDEQTAIGRDSIEQAIKNHLASGAINFDLATNPTVMASFRPFPSEFDKAWTIGVLADKSELTGGIRRSTIRTFVVAMIYAALAIVLMTYFMRRITQPLRRITAETRKIRDFDLEGDFTLRSPITEIDNLAWAVSNMKTGLRSFKAFVPVDLVQLILSSGKGLEIGGEMREVTLMFSDIEAFSRKCETLPASIVFKDLSTYFGTASDIIEQHKGTVDKFIGDAIMALWNAPQDDPDHTVNACRAALACALTESQIQPPASGPSLFPVRTRFGVHMGTVIVGNVGSPSRMQYTALGSDVNLASRLEGLNKKYGTTILVTEKAAERVKDYFLLRFVDLTIPAGTSNPVPIFELIADLDPQSPCVATALQVQLCHDWRVCIEAYETRDWSAVLKVLSSFQETYPMDPVVLVYLERCRAFHDNPPPVDWDGVHAHLQK